MPTPQKYLFVCLSSIGYLFPAIRLAHVLQNRGQHVLFLSTTEHALLLNTQGIEHLGVRNDAVPFMHTADWFQAANAPHEQKVLDQVIATYQPDVLVGSPLVLAAFVAADKHRLPLVSIGFTEYLYPTVHDAAEKNWRLQSITDFYNSYRAQLNLGPISVAPLDSPLLGTRYLLRSVPALNDQVALPPAVRYVGALYWEPAYENRPLQRFCAASRAARVPVVYVQIGRLFEAGHTWQRLLELLRAAPLRFIVDIGRADYVQAGTAFGPNFFVAPFIPLGAVADSVAFVLCSAQSTAVTSALAHGKPLLCLPHSADSVELARRLVRKGVALAMYETPGLDAAQWARCCEQLLAGTLQPAVDAYRQQFGHYGDDEIYGAVQDVAS